MAVEREDRAIAILMAACVLVFVAQWPSLAREAFEVGVDLGSNPNLAGALFGWVFVAPLILYALAALTHVAARAIGGKGTWFRARIALFWALLAASPLWLFHGLVSGFLGEGPEERFVALLAILAFGVFWGIGLFEAEWQKTTK